MESYLGPNGLGGVPKVRGAKILNSQKIRNFSLEMASVGS